MSNELQNANSFAKEGLKWMQRFLHERSRFRYADLIAAYYFKEAAHYALSVEKAAHYALSVGEKLDERMKIRRDSE